MACLFIRDKDNNIIAVRNQDGTPNQLFQQALDRFGDRQQAIDIVAMSQSEYFQQNIKIEVPYSIEILDIDDWEYNEDTDNYIIGSTNNFIIESGGTGTFFIFKDSFRQEEQVEELGEIIIDLEKDSFNRVHISGLSSNNKNKGFGKEIYSALIEYVGIISTSDGAASTKDAQRVWDSLIKSGRYYWAKVGPHTAVSNSNKYIQNYINRTKEWGWEEISQGSPQVQTSLNEVLEYISRENGNQNTLNAKQRQDLRNSLMSLEISSVDQLRIEMNNVFYNNGGIFLPSESSLRNSGLYTEYEIQTIINDIDLQERIKSSLEALNNTDYNEEDYADYANLGEVQEKSNEFNYFGKLSVINPYIVNEDITNILAAPQDRQQFNDNLQQITYPRFLQNVNPDTLYNEMTQYVRAQEWVEDSDGNIQTEIPVNNTRAAVDQGMKINYPASVIGDIDYILGLSDNTIQQNFEQSQILLDSIEQTLINSGLDVVGLNGRAEDPQLKPFLASLRTFLNNPVQENIQSFVDNYNSFFQIDTSLKTRVFSGQDTNRNYVYLESTKAEDQLLEDNSILKVQDNLYIRVRRQPLENLYNTVFSYKNLFPNNINNIPRLQRYVQERIGELPYVENADIAEELVLLKMYYGLPMNILQNIDVNEQLNNNSLFDGSTNYLQNEFVADFNIKALKEKYKNSDKWQNFYSLFNITSKGLTLRYTDPITVENVKSWMQDERLGQYSLMSKEMPSLVNTSEDFSDVEVNTDTMRSLYTNYPLLAPVMNNESIRINDDVLIAKNTTDQFLRIGREVYENIEAKDSLNLFVKLPAANPNFNFYNISAPTTDIQLNDYGYLETMPDNWMSQKRLLNKEQKEEINQKYFNCN